jgi:peptide/nickel transport system substrate-binding protein
MNQKLLKQSLAFLMLAFLLFACNAPIPNLEAPQPVEVTPAAQETPTPEMPAAPQPEVKYFNICLGQEPNTLYPYANPNQAARSVLAAIYDGPIDIFLNGYQPVILETIPSLANGDAQIVPVTVTRGDLIVNTADQVVLLDAGVEFFPPGCNDLPCAQRYSGTGEVEMEQMVVTFRINPEVGWADGQPLSASDSVFAFRIASDPQTPASKYKIDRTQVYEEADELTTQWWGRPGFIDPTYPENFWSPLPFHAWASIPAQELAQAEAESRPPLGWGPYQFENWTRGESIRLRKNPNYFRAEDGLPAFDVLTFRFLTEYESGIGALTSSQCDLLDPSLRPENQLEAFLEMEASGAVKVAVAHTNVFERLDFGLRPASYDDGIDLGDRLNFFADVRTRQAIAYCLNRQRVVDDVLLGLSYVPNTFIHSDYLAHSPDAAAYPFDPNQGIALLEEAGWRDDDQNPATPRTSSGVQGLPDGIPLRLTYQTTETLQRRQVADILSASLGECGIAVDVNYRPVNELYAPGPDGPLFGRQFDLAVYAVGAFGAQPSCLFYTEAEIPSISNQWLGMNVMGYRNADFDTLCQKARRSLPDQPAYSENYAGLQTIFVNDLPSIPLYARLKVAITRPDMCNFALNSNTVLDFWNLEEWDFADNCRQP